MREKLIEILRKPIFPHELADPAEVVADYLLDNGVVPVVRCKDCVHMKIQFSARFCNVWCMYNGLGDEGFCNYGEREDK